MTIKFKEQFKTDIQTFNLIKSKYEQAIASQISPLIDKFQDETGIKIGSIFVNTIDLNTMGEPERVIVSGIDISVDLGV